MTVEVLSELKGIRVSDSITGDEYRVLGWKKLTSGKPYIILQDVTTGDQTLLNEDLYYEMMTPVKSFIPEIDFNL